MSEPKNNAKNDELAKALQLLADDRQQRMQACMQEIQAVLQKYGFDLTVNDPIISLVPLPENPVSRVPH